MMRELLAAAVLLGAAGSPAMAHFGMIVPSTAMLDQEDGREITLTVGFAHPFAAEGMRMERPAAFGVRTPEAMVDLSGELRPAEVLGEAGYTLTYPVTRPGAHLFHVEPRPYWEPAEDCFIIHYTKTYVAAFGDDSGWDVEIGAPVEIVPLSRPFGLWEGNVFQGVVKRDRAPVPYAEIEVEHFNADGVANAPSELMHTQTVRADAAGVFTYAPPASGWWGFAALETADYTLEHEGAPKPVELGAVIWVHFEPWSELE
jgi:cobalt/nickel transport protein